MNVNDAPAASRQFVAHPPFWGSKVASITTPAWQKNPAKSYAIMVVGVLAFSAVVSGLFLGMQSLPRVAASGSREPRRRFPALRSGRPLRRCLRLVLVVSTREDRRFRHERRPDCQ